MTIIISIIITISHRAMIKTEKTRQRHRLLLSQIILN